MRDRFLTVRISTAGGWANPWTAFGLAWLLALLFLSGCGGGNSGNGAGSSTTSSSATWMTGNWQITLQKSTGKPKTESGFLAESDGAITGSLLLSGGTCSGVGNVTGTTTGNSVSMSVNNAGQTLSLQGTLGQDQASMTGTYTLLAGGCGASENGIWVANLVQPLGGDFQGTFTAGNGTSTLVSGSLSQAATAQVASASITGNITAADSACLASANISGVVSGTAVVLNLLDDTGAQLGQATGTLDMPASTASASIQGSYTILPLPRPQPPKTPCLSGQNGSFCMVTGAPGVACSSAILISSLDPSNPGDPVTFTVTVTSTGTFPPTGTVTFKDGTTALGSPVPLTNAVATITTSSLASGLTHSITAAYSGDANSAPCTSNVVGQVVRTP